MPLDDLLEQEPENEVLHEPEQTQSSYSFSTGSLDDYKSLIGEIKQPKKEYPQQQEEEIQEVEPDKPTITKVSRVAKTKASQFIVSGGDKAIAFLCDMISDNDGEENFNADEDEKRELQEYVAMLLPDDKEVIPPWLMLVVTAGLIYGPKFKDAFKLKKYKKALEEQQIKNAQIQQENEQLRQQLQQKSNA